MTGEEKILNELFLLIQEQAAALDQRLSAEMAGQCQERSDRICELLDQISERNGDGGHGKR